jgi:raffinose/stachyose/melibiose transport system substrate-binding protein
MFAQGSPTGQDKVHRPWRVAAGLLAGCIALALAACGGSASPNASTTTNAAQPLSSATKGTLTQWNWNTEADDPGAHAMMPVAINLFERQYPNLKVTNLEMTLDEQNNKLPLALSSGSSSPDVTETNEGYQSMGRLVADKELIPLESYDKLYNWSARIGSLPLQYNSFTPDGKSFGQGNIYGIPITAAPLAIFYNKALLAKAGAVVPTDWATFVKDLALVKRAGITPLAYGSGQPTVYQPVHVFYTLADAYAPASTTITFVFHQGAHPTINVPGYVQAAQTLASWSKEGYFPAGYSGLSGDQALSTFTSSKAAFFIEGEWYISAVQQALGSKAGFWVPPSVTGGPGEGYSIPVHSSKPDAAAAFINVLLSPTMQTMALKEGEVPVVAPSDQVLAKFPPMIQAATRGWQTDVKANTLVPYLDYATPNYLNQLTAAIQELQAGRITPQSMINELQSDYETYWSSK